MDTVTILCIEDDTLLLDFLIRELARIVPPATRLIGASRGLAGLDLARTHRPRLVILDLRLPDLSGFQVAGELAAMQPAPRVLVLTSTAPDAVLHRIPVSPIHGFLLKSSAHDRELAAAVTELWQGRTYYPPAILDAIAQARRQPDHFAKTLSDRELELVALFGFGWTHERIARHTQLSPATVRTHHQNILTKLGLHGREELMRWAIKKGFTDFRYEPGTTATGQIEEAAAGWDVARPTAPSQGV